MANFKPSLDVDDFVDPHPNLFDRSNFLLSKKVNLAKWDSVYPSRVHLINILLLLYLQRLDIWLALDNIANTDYDYIQYDVASDRFCSI